MATKRPPKWILAFDWDARAMRIVLGRLSKRGVTIDGGGLYSVAIPKGVDPADPGQMGRLIRRVLDEEEISAKHAIVDVPRDQAILNTLTLPCQAPGELPGMVYIQVAKELPFPITEAVIDFTTGPREADATMTEVLVAAVRHEIVEQYRATFAAAGLKLDRVGLRPYANKVAACALLKHAMPERVLLIDVTATLMEINVLRNSFLEFSRAALVAIPKDVGKPSTLSIALKPPAGREDEDDDRAESPQSIETSGELDAVIRSLLVEVTRSIEAYRATDVHTRLDHVVIVGDTGVEESLAEAIQKRLDASTELYNPASTFGWNPDEGASASAFAAGLGLVLGHADEEALYFDFLHPKRTVSARVKQFKKARYAAGVAGMFLVAGAYGFYGYTQPGQEKLQKANAKIAELRRDLSGSDGFLKLMREVEAFDARQYVWVDVLHDVVSVLPDNKSLVVDQLEMNQKEGRIMLKTRGAHRDTATDTIRNLEEFRRPGRDKPRFKAGMGGQTEKEGRYPFHQIIRITVLDDQGASEKKKKKGETRE